LEELADEEGSKDGAAQLFENGGVELTHAICAWDEAVECRVGGEIHSSQRWRQKWSKGIADGDFD
jgi:hypothetical protein